MKFGEPRDEVAVATPTVATVEKGTLYQPTVMHVKAVLIDGAIACVGSVNLNRRSVE